MDAERLQHFFDISLSLLCAADAGTNTFVDLNPAWERILGWSLDELRSRPFTEFIHPDDLAATFTLIAEMVGSGRDAVNFENRYRHKDGSWVWLSWTGLVRDGRFYSSAQPVGEYKRVLAALMVANEELSQFAYAASHDLQEPLRAITGHLAAVDPTRWDAETREALGYVNLGARRMQQLLDALLAYTRIDSSAPERHLVPMAQPLHSALDALCVAISEAGARVEIEGVWPMLPIHEVQISTVFQNLLANAVKYRSPGRPPRIIVRGEKEGAGYLFRVIDDGVGFDGSRADRAFLLFQRLHRASSYPGMGVGLALVKRIVVRHAGRVGISSVAGEGTQASFWLPEESQ